MEPDRLHTLARGADYFANLGRGPRVVAAVVLAVPAAYFLLVALVMPVPATHFALRGEWPLAWGMLGLGAGHGVVGFALGWLARRLWRGAPSANRTTIFPTWLVGAFLIGFLTPIALGSSVFFGLYAVRAAEAGDISLSGIWAAGAVGWVFGLARAYRTFARLVRGSH